jgi:hypothetical protein
MSGITEGRKKAKIIANDIRSAGTGSEFVYLLLEIPDEGNPEDEPQSPHG